MLVPSKFLNHAVRRHTILAQVMCSVNESPCLTQDKACREINLVILHVSAYIHVKHAHAHTHTCIQRILTHAYAKVRNTTCTYTCTQATIAHSYSHITLTLTLTPRLTLTRAGIPMMITAISRVRAQHKLGKEKKPKMRFVISTTGLRVYDEKTQLLRDTHQLRAISSIATLPQNRKVRAWPK